MDHTGKGKTPEPVTRLDQMKGKGQEPVLPHNPAEHITDWLFEIGPSAPGSMGEVPIGWPDVAAWTCISGIELTPWEGRTIRRLSQVYVAQRYDARKPNCPEPRVQADELVARSRVDEQFKAMLGALRPR